MTWVPLCMTQEEHEDWRAANAVQALTGARASRPCEDCTYEFRSAALLENRCNGVMRRSRKPIQSDPRRLLQFSEYRARRLSGTRIRRTPEQVAALRQRLVALVSSGATMAHAARSENVPHSYATKLVKR